MSEISRRPEHTSPHAELRPELNVKTFESVESSSEAEDLIRALNQGFELGLETSKQQ